MTQAEPASPEDAKRWAKVEPELRRATTMKDFDAIDAKLSFYNDHDKMNYLTAK